MHGAFLPFAAWLRQFMLHLAAASVAPKDPSPTLFARAGFKRSWPDLNASGSETRQPLGCLVVFGIGCLVAGACVA